jgi:hypothetical protein
MRMAGQLDRFAQKLKEVEEELRKEKATGGSGKRTLQHQDSFSYKQTGFDVTVHESTYVRVSRIIHMYYSGFF